MIMTLEEARIELQAMKDTFEEYETGGSRCQMALNVALTALRPVSREQVEKILSKWEPCEFCGEWIGGDCTPREKDVGYKIYAGYTKQVSVDDFWEDETENLNFCPICSRPFTAEAVEMVMERMEKLYNA